jgi:hypothetical protein
MPITLQQKVQEPQLFMDWVMDGRIGRCAAGMEGGEPI